MLPSPPPGVAEAPALFIVDGGRIVPTVLTQGPWDQGHQFGGAAGALVVWAAERVPSLVPMGVVRVTVDLMRPVPIKPLTVATRIVREGKRLQVLEVVVRHDELEVAWATVLRLRAGDLGDVTGVELPAGAPAPPADPVPLDPAAFVYRGDRWLPGITGAVDWWAPPGVPHAFAAPTWVRVKVPVVAGEAAASPVAQLALVADFTSGQGHPRGAAISGINADLTVNVVRPPTEEWIVLDGEGWSTAAGVGLSRSLLLDAAGVMATVACSRLLDRLA